MKEFIEQARKGSIDIVEHAHKALESAEKINQEYNYVTAWCDVIKRAEELKKLAEKGEAKGKLFGVMISVKDQLCVKGVESTSSSAILRGYKPLFNATVIEKCLKEGAIILGKTVMDEFGFGGFSTNVGIGYKKPLNPLDKKRACGGSSGGAAGLTAKANFPHIAIGESTGGSIVNPASFCGVAGITPTYGRVSRYGLMSYGNSLDKIGSIAKSVDDAALLLEVMSGYDEKDSTSSNRPVDNLTEIPGAVQGLRIGIIKEAYGEGIDNDVRKNVLAAVQKLEQKGARKIEVSLPISLKYGLAVYYMLGLAEASTNLAKHCGIKYGASENLTGSYNEYFARVRSNNFGEEVKRRILLGTFARMAGYRDAFYKKAAQIRTLMIQEYAKAFKDVDVLITPTVPIIAPTFEEIKKLTLVQNYAIDLLTVAPNLVGLPHITVPCGTCKGMPIGLMITANHFAEQKMIQVANACRKI